ncbi:MAG TPA: c-type cytochrome, partial [Steroidobacteraceae bacterium]
MDRCYRLLGLLCLSILCSPAVLAISFTDAQIAHGRSTYGHACAVCHGANLEGAAGAPLTGVTFARNWGDGHHNLRDLYESIAKQMPKNAPGSLSDEDNLGILAYVLAKNGYASAAQRLTLAALDVTLSPPGSGVPTAPASAAAPAGTSFPQPPAAVAAASDSSPDDADLLHIQDSDWLTYNRTLAGDRFSPLAQINTHNAGKLQVKCLLQLGELGSFETSPLVYQGRLYLTTVHKVFAVDGTNCAVLWSYSYVPVDP